MVDFLIRLLFPALLITAAATDIFTMKISNWISLVLIVNFGLAAWLAGLPAETIVSHIAACMLLLAIGFTLFAFNLIGGGDAKFLSAKRAWWRNQLGPLDPGFRIRAGSLEDVRHPGYVVWVILAGRRDERTIAIQNDNFAKLVIRCDVTGKDSAALFPLQPFTTKYIDRCIQRVVIKDMHGADHSRRPIYSHALTK